MEILREELREAQSDRTSLIKWKLLLISAIGAIGLGLTDSPSVPNVELILCCIPFVCAYTDLLSQHKALVVTVIGEFIRSYPGQSDEETSKLIKYEEFAWELRNLENRKGKKISVYALERITILWSSIAFSTAIIIYAILSHKVSSIPIAISGILGIITTIWIEKSYRIRRSKIRGIDT